MNLLLYHIRRLRVLSVIALLGRRIKYIPLLPIITDELFKLYTFLFYPNKFLAMQDLINQLKKTNAETNYHRFGGIEFIVDNKEIAHIHSNGLFDIFFPKQLSKALIEKGWCEDHHVFPGSGWVSFRIQRYTKLKEPMQLFYWSKELKTREKAIKEIKQELNHLIQST